MLTVTVSQLNRYIRAVLEETGKLSDLYVQGEISGYSRHYRSGHVYFSLRDKESSIRAVMFKSYADELRFEPCDGMAVLLRAGVGVYERDGVYQLYVTDMQPDGAGALAVAFEQVKRRLAGEGLFEERHKKPLPPYPARIGVVTSESGAALQDIVNVLSRRWPLAALVLSPAAVQGRDAPAGLVAALETLDREGGCDVIILGRGGGSPEDLSCFNDEGLARAVFACGTPVVSAVGHETDTTICDFVADLRAPTPSAAAELCAPSAEQLRGALHAVRSHLRGAADATLARDRDRLAAAAASPGLRSPMAAVLRRQERLDFLSQSLYNKSCIFLRESAAEVRRRAALLEGLSPLRVLGRGYCVAGSGQRPVTTIGDVRAGDPLDVRFHDGTAHCTIETIDCEDLG